MNGCTKERVIDLVDIMALIDRPISVGRSLNSGGRISMQELHELKQLRAALRNEPELEIKLGQLEKSLEERINSFRKKRVPELSEKSTWDRPIFGKGILITLWVTGIYTGIYLVAWIITLLGVIFTGFGRAVYGKSTPVLDHILYVIGYPATWFGKLVLPWVRNADILPGHIRLGHIKYFIVSIVVFAAVAAITLFIADLLAQLVSAPSRASRAVKNRQENTVIRKENSILAVSDEREIQAFKQSAEYVNRVKAIAAMRAELERTKKQISESKIVHKEFKDERSVKQLISYLETGRAETIKEAIRCLDDDKHKRAMESLAMETAMEAEQTRKNSERALAYSQQAAANAEWAAEAAEDARDEARTGAWANLGATLGLAHDLDRRLR